MLTYQDCINLTQKRDRRKLCNNTYLEKHRLGDMICFKIILHRTDIVKIFENNTYQLKTGGWLTKTTKDRINMYSPAKIYQKRGNWFLDNGNEFQENMIVSL